jgi:hypothetical protein
MRRNIFAPQPKPQTGYRAPTLNLVHPQVLPALVSIMDDVENHRVQSHAAAAIINFTENCGKDILVPYLEPLLGKLVYLLLGGQRIVQEQVNNQNPWKSYSWSLLVFVVSMSMSSLAYIVVYSGLGVQRFSLFFKP